MNGFNIINITNLSLHCFNAVNCAKCGSKDFRAKFLWCLFVTTVRCSRLTFSLAVCTCLICLYIQPTVCIVTALKLIHCLLVRGVAEYNGLKADVLLIDIHLLLVATSVDPHICLLPSSSVSPWLLNILSYLRDPQSDIKLVLDLIWRMICHWYNNDYIYRAQIAHAVPLKSANSACSRYLPIWPCGCQRATCKRSKMESTASALHSCMPGSSQQCDQPRTATVDDMITRK